MKAFQLIPAVAEYAQFADYAKEAKLGATDLILTNEYIYEPAISKLNLGCQTLFQEKYGAGEPTDVMVDAILDELHGWRQGLTLTLALLIIVADYAFTTRVLNHDAWADQWLLKLAGAVMIASSVMANFWLIYQKMDAWIWWILYSLAGILFYVLLGNIYCIVLFLFYLVINASAFVAWQRLRKN